MSVCCLASLLLLSFVSLYVWHINCMACWQKGNCSVLFLCAAGSDDTIVEGPGVAAMFTPGASPDPEKYTESPSPAVADITLQMQSNGSIPVVYTLTAQAAAEYTYYDSAGAVYGAVEPPAQGPVPEGFLSAEVPASSPSDFPEDGALPPSTTAPSPQPQVSANPTLDLRYSLYGLEILAPVMLEGKIHSLRP